MDTEIDWYYGKGLEQNRLESKCILEKERTQRIILDRIPARKCTVGDIGGAAGAYAFWLAGLGHSVFLSDAYTPHIRQAKEMSKELNLNLAGLQVADARSLPYEDDKFDMVLLLGPLYHLIDWHDRIVSLRECKRTLKPGGRIVAAVISRYGSAIDGFFRGLVSDENFVEIMKQDLETGIHLNKQRVAGYFTTAYFHTPQQLREEMQETGFEEVEILAVESVFSNLPDFVSKWKESAYRSLLLQTLKKIESDQTIVGLGGHIIGVGTKPSDVQ